MQPVTSTRRADDWPTPSSAQLISQSLHAAMQQPRDGAGRFVQLLGDLAEFQTLQVMQPNRIALSIGKPIHRLSKPQDVFPQHGILAGCRIASRQQTLQAEGGLRKLLLHRLFASNVTFVAMQIAVEVT